MKIEYENNNLMSTDMYFIYMTAFSFSYHPKKDVCLEIEEPSWKEKIYRCETMNFGRIDLIRSPGFTMILHVTLARFYTPLNFYFLTFNWKHKMIW